MREKYAGGLISGSIRFMNVPKVGMIQNNEGEWVSADNYVNLSRQLDSAVHRTLNLQMEIDSLTAENAKLREALEKIAAVENRYNCGDWDEIEEARGIARAALKA